MCEGARFGGGGLGRRDGFIPILPRGDWCGRERRMTAVARGSVVLGFFCLLLVGLVGADRSARADGVAALVAPDAKELREAVVTLTGPEMAGRGSGTDGGQRAAERIAQWLGEAGLQPGGDGGT